MAAALLCETVTADSMAELLRRRDATRADLVELRVDGIADLDVHRALSGRRTPAIVTCRPVWEGGRFDGAEDTRRAILARALAGGAEFVDIEWQAGFHDMIGANRSRIVVSSHDFKGVPSDLADRVRAMRQTGAGLIKIAVTAHRLADNLPLLDITKGGAAVVVGMGDAGVPSRLLATRFGSRWTYGGFGAAPGQIPVERMRAEFRFNSIGCETALYGVVGTNVMHSLSPAMHNAAFAAAGCDAAYVPLRASDFTDFLVFADALGVRGASVTIPFKQDALRTTQRADDLTRAVGAANTLRRIGGSWEATNTDVAGFLDPLDAQYPGSLAGARVTVLGAGGAARAAIVALQSRGAKVTVCGRHPERGREVAREFGVDVGTWPAAGGWDLLVNTTPLGSASFPEESPLPGGPFTGRVVYDLTYGMSESPLLRQARNAGCITVGGVPMLVAQAERQFEWWTGQKPAPGVMAAAAKPWCSGDLCG